jgi:hypothetical protein
MRSQSNDRSNRYFGAKHIGRQKEKRDNRPQYFLEDHYMIKYVWRQILFSFVLLYGGLMTFVLMLMLIFDPDKNLKDLPLFIGFVLSFTVSFVILKKQSISNNEFIEIMKNNGFISEHKVFKTLLGTIPTFLAMSDDRVLLYACFSARYWPELRDLFNLAGTGSRNLKYYFPCRTASEFNHNIVKSGHEIEIEHGLYPFRDHSKIKNTNSELNNIVSKMCADVDFLVINNLQAGQGFILVETGPSSLAYGEYLKKNVPAVLKFIQAFRTYYDCQDDKWDRQINMSNLNENIDALNKEFVNSLREKYKNK